MTFWIEMAVLCLLATLPCLLALRGGGLRGRQAPALALHRAQLETLDREASLGLIAPEEREAARLEVQRRLLAEADRADSPARAARGGRATLLAGAVLLPLLTLALYGLVGHPQLPPAPMAARVAAARAAQGAAAHDMALIETLRAQLQGLDPATPQARQGYDLLARAEASRGQWAAAAAAWRVLLKAGFDPTTAAEVAEAQCQAEGHVSADSAMLFKHALAAAPADAPWRLLAEQRIAQSEHDSASH